MMKSDDGSILSVLKDICEYLKTSVVDFSSCHWCCKTLSINILALTILLLNYDQIRDARKALDSGFTQVYSV